MKLTLAHRVWLIVAIPVSRVNWAAPKLGMGSAVLWGRFSFGALLWCSQFPILRAARGRRDALRAEDVSAAQAELSKIIPVFYLAPTLRRVLPQWETALLLWKSVTRKHFPS